MRRRQRGAAYRLRRNVRFLQKLMQRALLDTLANSGPLRCDAAGYTLFFAAAITALDDFLLPRQSQAKEGI